ncbi:TAXI family TRAP transporter solute-binding subunit [Bacillus sp. S3]|uniref:TAXI family TRAP transporter solute-binding subunit n=1 Tax=Bacillus sp. S3 TaxID=486398 RepID=UPI0011896579|nr:TAXI family TRAP transporter solute-binding subunit [Bacillus sp. S3]QCJ41224.1 TAXI family TRAP transporter solute-binding subunit [Bacillus sp. S3]
MKKKAFIVFLLLTTLLLASCGQQEKASTKEERTKTETKTETKTAPLSLTMAGGSAGGFWSLIGEGVGSILRKSNPGTQFSYETGNGVKNVISVSSGQVPLGIAFNFEVKAGLEGEEPFKSKVDQVSALINLYDNAPLQIAITKDFADKYGIASMEDIAEKKPPIRIGVNQRGNMVEKVNKYVFESYGISYDDIKKWGGEVYYEAWKPSAEQMKDNKLDWTGDPVFAPDATLMELSATKDILLLPINEKAQKLLNEKMGTPPSILKGGTYKFQPNDINTVNAGAMVMVDPNMTEEEAYTITKTLVENIDSIRALHKDLESLTPEKMVNVAPAKLHPGAAKYFKEIGILK